MDFENLFYKHHLATERHHTSPNVNLHFFDGFSLKEGRFKMLKYFTVIHVLGGQGKFKLELDVYNLKPSGLYFGYPGQIISDINVNKVKGYVMFADAEFLLKTSDDFLDISLFQLYTEAHYIPLDGGESELLKGVSDRMQLELRMDMHRKQEVLVSLVRLHILYTDRCFYKFNLLQDQDIHPKVRALFTILNMDRTLNLKVSEYAYKLAVSPNYLNNLVKNCTGKSLKSIIKEKTIQRACVYLLHSDFSVKEIAYLLKYNYPQYFHRDFKQAKGVTPVVYRKDHR